MTQAAADVEATFRRALQLHRQSRLDEARTLYGHVLRSAPGYFPALHMLGVIALQSDQPQLAADVLGNALTVDPASVAARVNYGTALHELGRFGEAIASYDQALALRADCAEAHHNRGNALRALERHADAVASYDRAVAFRPGYADALMNRGLALSDLGQHAAAVASHDAAIAHRPDYADAHYNRGNELRKLDQLDAAIASYDAAIALQPGFADAHLNRACALVDARRLDAALAACDRAIALRPADAAAHCNRAGVLQYLGRYAAAVAGYDRAIASRPGHAQAHAGRGRALRELRRHEDAIASYERAMALDAESAALVAVCRHLKMQICDWRGLDTDVAIITAAIARDAGDAVHPFYVLTLCGSAALQRRAAERWVRAEHPTAVPAPESRRREPGEPIHVGYFSADYHEHATSFLIAELFERHDRSKCRITLFSFGPPSNGAMRRRLELACDEFIDVRGLSDAGIAALARGKHIDIAVDLKGFTQDHRSGIFARRAAPLQLSYLGYPGTMGAPFMDYLIADPVLVPESSEAHYAEKIIRLPHSYQANDATRVIGGADFTRAQAGLPPTGFVFCCFNNTYKILPATFDCWMRILARVPDSSLWLLGDNTVAVRNLRREAAARGVDPDRLAFAQRLGLPEHLARHRCADLFLDTLPCNAHTTASDALWAGLPVLTCAGEAFASRVAASLLSAVGLPELIATTLGHYEELAVALATHPSRLAALRGRLWDNRLRTPLFDTPGLARHMESAFARIVERHPAGAPEEPVGLRHDLGGA